MLQWIVRPLTYLLFSVALVSCTSNRDSSMALQCSKGLDAAYKEMKDAEAKGFRGAVGITKAASLLTAAKVQYEFKRYPNCVDKVRRARIHISRAQEQ
jgi:hypothetical protein